jgi:hypothetical protein
MSVRYVNHENLFLNNLLAAIIQDVVFVLIKYVKREMVQNLIKIGPNVKYDVNRALEMRTSNGYLIKFDVISIK